MLQALTDINAWYDKDDPWNYENSLDDQIRRDNLLNELPHKEYNQVLDIGCGHGFITRELPGKRVIGVDISPEAIKQAERLGRSKNKNTKIEYKTGDLFTLPQQFPKMTFDLIILTGVLYPQYIGRSNTLVYQIIDTLLAKNGILVSVHIDDWYTARFPYLKLQEYFYGYLTYTHRLEVYTK